MRLLLVEPHSLLARALTIGLHEEGFIVEVVSDTEKADERLHESRYDVVLLDVPAGSGLHTFRRWRRWGLRTPVLALAASAVELEGRDVPAGFDISIKPFALEDLLQQIRDLVRNHG